MWSEEIVKGLVKEGENSEDRLTRDLARHLEWVLASVKYYENGNKKLFDQVNELKEQVKDLQEKVYKSEEDVDPVGVSETENTTWPKDDDTFYYITSNGLISEDRYNPYGEFLRGCLEIGNCFRTRDEAELAVKKLKALKRLRDKGFKFESYTRNHTGTYDIFFKQEMPYLGYEGIEDDLDLLFGEKYESIRDNLSRPKKLVRNRIKCLKCGDVIESKSVHDYAKCSCGACATDGGLEYMHINGNAGDWEDLSEWEEEDE